MFTNRLFNVFVVIVLAVVIALTAQAALSQMDLTYRESKEQVQQEYELGERYGELPSNSVQFTEEQSLREYQLGERYGETPQNSSRFSAEQMLREYILGERYGQTPSSVDREYWLGERYGVTP